MLFRLAAFLLGARTSGRRIPADVRHILVVRQHDQLGDMLCAVPLLRCLKSAYPAATMTLVASPVNHDVMLNNPSVDRLILYDKKVLRTSPSAVRRFFRELRSTPFDIAVVPATVSMSVTSDLLALLSRAPVRIGAASLEGIANPAAACHTIPVTLDWRATPHVHQSERNLEMLRPLGCSTTDTSHEVGMTPVEREEAELLLRQFRSSARRIIGFHPGAGKPGNRWPAERFAGIINRFCVEQDAVAMMTIGPMDDSVRDAVLPLVRVPLITLQGLSIRRIAAAISCMDLFLTNDTGIMHVAAGVGVPTLALFGPTDPLQWAPRSPRVKAIQSPTGDIDDIGTDQVYDMLKMMLARG